jgi:ribosomal protein S27E
VETSLLFDGVDGDGPARGQRMKGKGVMTRGASGRASGADGAVARRITCPACGRALGLWMSQRQFALAAGATLLGFDASTLVVRCPDCARAAETPAPTRSVAKPVRPRSRAITCPICGRALGIRRVGGSDPNGRDWTNSLRLAPAVGGGGMHILAGRLHVKCPTCGVLAEEPDMLGEEGRGDD